MRQNRDLRGSISRPQHTLVDYCGEAIFTSLLVFFFTLPILVYSIGTISSGTVFVTLMTTWLIAPITILGLLLFCLALVLPGALLGVLLIPLWLMIEIFMRSINLFSSSPIALIAVSPPDLWGCIGYYCILGGVCVAILANRRRQRWNLQ